MVATEIVLILIGVVFLLGSFFVSEKLSQHDLDQITLMSETDLKIIAEKQVKEVKKQVENSVEEIIDESLATTKRGLERETNNKIMAVSEYSDTVIDTMNKTHNEIIFLYSMLNEKQTEAAEMVVDLQKITKCLRDMNIEDAFAKMESVTNVVNKTADSDENVVENNPDIEKVAAGKEETLVNEQDDNASLLNKNEQILLLYKEGKDEVEIAKTLDCGLGVVRLVLGLYHEA